MTDDQKAKYLTCGASRCPYCGHDKLDCDRLTLAEFEDEYECKTRCTGCGKEWTDVYRVVDVRCHTEDGECEEESEEANNG